MNLHKSELLVCNDLSSALNVKIEEKLWKRLKEQSIRTCLIVSHRKAVLKDGELMHKEH